MSTYIPDNTVSAAPYVARSSFRHTAIRFLSIIAGSAISAFAINAFLVSHHLLAGGVTGVAILLQYMTPLPTWAYVLLLNIPIFLAGSRHVNRDFAVTSLVGMLSFSTFLFLTIPAQGLLDVQDTLLAALFGGLLNGLGLGLVFRQRGSVGGTDILAVIIRRYLSVDLGSGLLVLNALVVILSLFAFQNIELALYTLISIAASAMTLNRTMDGIETKKSVFIVTNRREEIADRIMRIMHRGVTVIHAEGAYTKQPHEMLYCVLTITQLARVKQIVEEIDPQAFMTVSNASEVLGRGFRRPEF